MDETSVVEIEQRLLLGEWVAVRVNLAGASDFTIAGDWTGCRSDGTSSQSYLGVAEFLIADRSRIDIAKLVAGASAWTPGDPVVEGSAAGENIPDAEASQNDHCSVLAIFSGPGAQAATQSWTYILVGMAPYSWINVTLSWTSNVESFEVVTGQADVRTKDQLIGGVHVTAFGPGASLAGGVALTHAAETETDTIGYWLPARNAGQLPNMHSCSINGQPCPVIVNNLHLLASEGPTAWDFSLAYEARANEGQYYALVLIPLDNHDYLSIF